MKKSYIFFVALFTINAAIAQWLPQNSGVIKNLRSVFFIDANTGYVVGDSGTILKTTNAGASWIALSSGTTHNLKSVQFTDFNTGYVAGETILKTSNAGASWSDISGGTNYGVSICFPNASTGYVVGGLTVGGDLNAIKTINGGSSWTDKSLIGNGSLNSVYFTDSNIGYIASDYFRYGAVFKTIDGGINWNFTYSAGTTSMTPLFSIYFPDANTGYAVGGGWLDNLSRIFMTTNGGKDWTLQFDALLHTLRSVYFKDATTGYAVGDSGTILNTSNGGAEWIIQNSGTSHNLKSVYFTDKTTGYAVGDSGTILKTINIVLEVNDLPSVLNSLKIYPNPSAINFTIETTGKGHISIFNINGNQLLLQEITQPKTTINISNLPSGVYFVKFQSEQSVQMGKFIKE